MRQFPVQACTGANLVWLNDALRAWDSSSRQTAGGKIFGSRRKSLSSRINRVGCLCVVPKAYKAQRPSFHQASFLYYYSSNIKGLSFFFFFPSSLYFHLSDLHSFVAGRLLPSPFFNDIFFCYYDKTITIRIILEFISK